MKRPRRLCNFRGPSRERLIDSRRLFIAVTRSTKRICFRQKIPREFKNSGISTPSIDTSRSSRDPYRLQIPTSMSESSLRVIVLPSFIVYPYFELDIEQDKIRKPLLIKQETE